MTKKTTQRKWYIENDTKENDTKENGTKKMTQTKTT